MPRYRLIEWDMDNGEVLYREEFEAKDIEEALKYLESIVKDAEKEGWECEPTPNGDYICVKEKEGYPIQRQLLIEEVN